MKRILTLTLIILATSCGVSQKVQKEQEKIVIGLSYSGISETTIDCYKKCVADAGAELYLFPTYPESDRLVQEYIGKCDAVIIPGKSSKDAPDRKVYDDKIIKATVDAGKPILGICFGHQRICHVFGASIKKIADTHPESNVCHKFKAPDGTNTGLLSEAHYMTVDPKSKLYTLVGTHKVMINTSHLFSVIGVDSPLKIVATSDDGVVEAVEGKYIMGCQFHPEYLYGKLKINKFLNIFTNLVEEAREVKNNK